MSEEMKNVFSYEFLADEGLVAIFANGNKITELADENGDPESVFEWFVNVYSRTNLALNYSCTGDCKSQQDQIKANAVMEFVNIQVGAFESGFVEDNQVSLYSMYRFAQHHVKDNYDVETKLMSEQWGNELADLSRNEPLEWQKPELTPEVEKGSEKLFWIAVEVRGPSTCREDEPVKTKTFLAHYQNRPLEQDEDGEYLDDDYLVNTCGDPIESIGWVSCQSHNEFDNYYEALHFSDTYELLGWAEYTPPKFNN